VVKLKTILLTGANGFIATQIARNLLADKEVTILALVRANDTKEAQAKLAREWWEYPELINALGTRIRAIQGNVCQPNLGLDKIEYRDIAEKTTHIIHTAADWRLLPIDELRKTNVQGTNNVITFAKEANKHHHFERLSHISTAYVAGAATGTIAENQLTDKYGFFTDYEHSKYEGEQIIQAAKEELPISIFRPSMVIGDSKTGAIKTFNTFYFPLRLYLTDKMRFMPVSRSLRINVVPVDYVAKTVVQLTFEPKAKGQTFHVVAPYESLPKLGELLDFVQKWAKTELSCKLPSPICLPMSTSSMKTALKLQRVFTGDRRISDALISLSPYFSENRQFNRDNLNNLLGPYDFKWQEIMPKLLNFAVYNSFFHRSDHTVHEQVLFRLDSKSHPVTYFDIIEGKTIRKNAEEMRQDILAATSALKTYGIAAGDRVALTGLNSSRHLAVDIAIGLAGAISVPLYYTTPPSDINDVLKASGPKLFFIGMPSLLSRVKELTLDVPIVSICRVPVPADAQRNVVSWEEFLSKGKDNTVTIKAPVGFGDIATLRYSSGTTGKPKGAIFRHDNLRYMAESIVSITSWKARNRTCSYLSFLPMGHVVEGILATYSPYYIPAPVEIYFLEDFRKLQEELPHVRPTVFFSVPRIYEKIWEALEKNPFGRFYIKTKSRLLKRAMRRTIRNMTLKRAGLNKCAQLIAGSASSEEDLLENYRKLGVEIHNAYGMTEAPLVTMNRLGRNRLGTVGEPMPFTEVKIAEDGEIMVKGPQVTVGYFDKSLEMPFKDGWLMTGDIGKLTDEGSLVIFGRKKELIKTSYGKCIYSGKIEGMIRELPGVSEAMLVGESKPYCSALSWVDKKQYNQETIASIDQAMEEMNKRLSNPEKIKKWALLVNNLSIENGDLTPNLKLKRIVVSQKYAKVIDSLYSGVIPEGEVHIGGVEKPGE
jgi:long-chain acyl-CoA synthetase